MRPPLSASLSLLLLSTIGCGVDSASANGELGRMTFRLTSDYYVEEHDLTEAAIVTEHEQFFSIDLTGEGEDDAGKRADEIEYVMTPDEGVELVQSGPDHDEGEDDADAELAPSLSLRVSDPGDYQLEARLNGDTFDRIQLSFDQPDALELSLYVREAWEEDFVHTENDARIVVDKGGQLAWLPIPIDSEGNRLLGDIEAEMTADPQTSVSPAANVDHVNEDEVQSFFGAPSLYFIELGYVTVTVTDTQNPAVGVAEFDAHDMVL